jgi:O-acetyl-ADP-ribose deacetylase (regulator of RNase III)
MKNLTLFSLFSLLFYTLPAAAAVSKTVNGVEIRIERGDITQFQAQAIVNAANPQLQAGGGVCGAIFAAAGLEQLQKACNQFPTNYELNAQKRVLATLVDQDMGYKETADDLIRCPVGQACITPSFNLQKHGIQYIIHAVGPDCRIIKDSKEQDTLLRNTYQNALRVAEENGVTSIAFPFISSAIYAFPKERAARIAVQEVVRYAAVSPKLTTISFVLYSDEDYDLFVRRLDRTHYAIAL